MSNRQRKFPRCKKLVKCYWFDHHPIRIVKIGWSTKKQTRPPIRKFHLRLIDPKSSQVKLKFTIQFFFEESINSSHHLFREFDWFELSSSLEICVGGQLLTNLWISDSQQSRQEQQQQQAIDRLQKQLNQQQSNKTFRAQEQEFQASSISNLLSNSFTLLKDLKAQSTDIPTNPPVIHG